MRSSRFWLALLATSLAACATGTVDVGGPGGLGGEVAFGLPARAHDDSHSGYGENFWQLVFAECGSSYFAVVKPSPQKGLELTEYIRVTFTVQADELTEADLRNGVKWKGRETMRAALKRSRGADNTWSDWSPAGEVAYALIGPGIGARQARKALGELGFASAPECPPSR